MNFGQALVYGLVQGLTEFLPVSSTAHLRIVQEFFGWKDPGAPFTAVIQLGTTLAVVLYFWRELLHITIGWARGLTNASYRGLAGVPDGLVPHPGHHPGRRSRPHLQPPDRDVGAQPVGDRDRR